MDPALRGGTLRRTDGQELGTPCAGTQDVAAVDGPGVPPAESASGCRPVPHLESAGTVRCLGAHRRPHHGAEQAGLSRYPTCARTTGEASLGAPPVQSV